MKTGVTVAFFFCHLLLRHGQRHRLQRRVRGMVFKLGKRSMVCLMTLAAQARPGNPGTSFLNFCYDLCATMDREMLMLYPSLSEMMTLGHMVKSKKTLCGLLFLSYGRNSCFPHLQALLSSQGGSLIDTDPCRHLGSSQEHSWLQ